MKFIKNSWKTSKYNFFLVLKYILINFIPKKITKTFFLRGAYNRIKCNKDTGLNDIGLRFMKKFFE
jgi:hypothetical protein